VGAQHDSPVVRSALCMCCASTGGERSCESYWLEVSSACNSAVFFNCAGPEDGKGLVLIFAVMSECHPVAID